MNSRRRVVVAFLLLMAGSLLVPVPVFGSPAEVSIEGSCRFVVPSLPKDRLLPLAAPANRNSAVDDLRKAPPSCEQPEVPPLWSGRREGVLRSRSMYRAGFDADPAQCTIEPRTHADLEQIVKSATPRPVIKRPPSGERIDPNSDTGKTVISTIEMLFACLNGGDRMRAYALYTDDYLASILQTVDLSMITTPQPNDPDEYTRIVAVDLHTLDNDEVIATVTLDPALIPVHKIFEFILIPTDDGWRIDRVINEIDFSLP